MPLSLDKLLATDDEPAKRTSLDDLLSVDEPVAKAAFRKPTAADIKHLDEWNKQSPEMPWWQSVATGANDALVGAGQVVQHVLPDAVLNAGRKITDPIVNAVLGGEPVDSGNTSTADFNAMVQRREQGYQADRKAAGKEGMDWWRVGGNVANPMTWLGPSGAGAGVFNAIKAGVQQGAFQALLQPVTSEGSFLWDKAQQAVLGAAAGGTLGAALGGLSKAFSAGARVASKVGGDDAAKSAAATKITDDTLKAAGADPAKIDPNLYSAIRQEVDDALKAGVDPDPKVMTNRADALALPVPINLTRGQATRDPMQFAWEQRVAGQQGVGEPLSDLLHTQNRALIENLNELGARNALEPFDASQRLIQHIEGVDAAAKAKIDEAYQAVRDSAGRPALMDHVTFVNQANDALDTGQLGPYLPATVRQQLNDIAAGKLPLTVNVAQQLDKVWGAAQRGTQDGSTKMAIGQLRDALNAAPVSDALGAESMQAYKAAREMARQRFAMIDANPAYKAVTEGVEPDKFFQKYVQGANVSELGGLKQLVGAENTAMLQQTLIGNLKKTALNRASEENGVFSQSAYNRVLQDPVQMPRLRELFADSPEVLGHLYRIGRVSEGLIKIPAASKVNTSNTASATANIIRDVARSETGGLLSAAFPRIAGVGKIVRDAGEKVKESEAVSRAVRPGVSTASKPASPGPKTRRLSDLAARASAAYALSESDE